MTLSTSRRAAGMLLVSLAMLLSVTTSSAQTDVPPAPPQPADSTAGPSFPPPDASNFTAVSPTKEQVLTFLETAWGYDPSRVFQVQAITKTPVPGISSVLVLVGEKGEKDFAPLPFLVTADGKHLIAGKEFQILPFGDHPYAENRSTLLKRADGPSRGGQSKDLEIVEFADFQCPHCKDAQPTVEKILADFPKAHFVFESFPLPMHPQAFHAAAYGACVDKLGGDKAFFDYAGAVFDGQAGLASDEGATLTLNSAVSKAGQDPAKVEACAKSPETKAAVEASVKLARDLDVNQTPFIFIDGRGIPLNTPYETLKQIIAYQAAMDGAAK